MARIPESEIERLKSEISLERLIGAAGIELKRAGADLVGCCPFHADKTPSLVVSPKKNLWHCLGACQAGGTVIDWVMRMQRVSFRHLSAFKKFGAERILIAYDRDQAGENAAAKLAEKLIAEGIECWRIEFPKGMDANEYALKVTPAAKSLGVAIRKSVWLGKGQAPVAASGGVRMCFLLELPALDECVEHLQNLAPFLRRELLDLLQPPLQPRVGCLGAALGGFGTKQCFDGDAQRVRNRGQQVRRRLCGGAFVIGHHALRNSDLGGECGLGDAGDLAQRGEPRPETGGGFGIELGGHVRASLQGERCRRF